MATHDFPGRDRSVQVPLFMKHAVDSLTQDPTGAAASLLDLGPVSFAVTPLAVLGLWGAAKTGAALFGELRNVMFAQAGAPRVIFRPMATAAPGPAPAPRLSLRAPPTAVGLRFR